MRSLTISLMALLLVACLPSETPVDSYTRAPSGQGHFVGADGFEHSVFRNIGSISYGETKDAEIIREALLGFTFVGSQGDPTRLTLQVPRGGQYSMAVYGPRTHDGLWGLALTETHGQGDLTIDNFSVPSSGIYFILLRVFSLKPAATKLSLACPSCDEPACDGAEVCDRFCPNGFAIDQFECPQCSCRGENCAQTGCAGTQICVYPCEREQCLPGQTCINGMCGNEVCPVSCDAGLVCVDGQCLNRSFRCINPQALCEDRCPSVESPVCGEVDGSRRTFGNDCRADCVNATGIQPGICPDQCSEMRPCPNGQQCLDGVCRTEACAECPETGPTSRVCGADGRTYDSPCLLQCRGLTEIHYRGSCLERCNNLDDCPLGDLCRPVSDERIPGNHQECRENEESPACVRTCRRTSVCSVDEGRCDSVDGRDMNSGDSVQGQQRLGCYPLTIRGGVCLPKCDPTQANNCGRGVCAVVDHYYDAGLATDGICLMPCDGERGCPDQLKCLPDYRGQMVCQSCACEAFPEMHICLNDEAYRNRCDALCDGVRPTRFEEPSQVEDCDGQDNDCDGRIDEEVGPQPCNDVAGCGEIQVCRNGQWSECEPAKTELVEVCDGIDNDCDGRIDESLRRLCGTTVGQCQQGRQACRNGRFAECQGEVVARRESCNELDDDCDGQVDEDLNDQLEICDQLDNDCDGNVDEGFDGIAEVCDRVDNDCDGRLDEGLDAVPEVCNGRDDDCDGLVDEGNRSVRIGCVEADNSELCMDGEAVRVLVQTCGSGIGQCRLGHRVCTEGNWGACIGNLQAQDEVCDGRDNDCDSRVDEDAQMNNPDAMECQPDCRHCPPVWQQACGVDGVIYESVCRAECVTGQAPQALRLCLQLDNEIDMRCAGNQNCLQTGPDAGICAAERLSADIDVEFSDIAACFTLFGTCQCVDQRCGFSSTDRVDRCIGANQGNARPAMQ